MTYDREFLWLVDFLVESYSIKFAINFIMYACFYRFSYKTTKKRLSCLYYRLVYQSHSPKYLHTAYTYHSNWNGLDQKVNSLWTIDIISYLYSINSIWRPNFQLSDTNNSHFWRTKLQNSEAPDLWKSGAAKNAIFLM